MVSLSRYVTLRSTLLVGTGLGVNLIRFEEEVDVRVHKNIKHPVANAHASDQNVS